jgi:O-antigen ligase
VHAAMHSAATPARRADRAAYVPPALRPRVRAVLRFSSVFWACLYFALLAISGHTYPRSLAFSFAILFTLIPIFAALLVDGESIPLPNRYLLLALLAWPAWAAASVMWSAHPRYTRFEVGTEIGWGLVTFAIFYVAARNAVSFRALIATAVGAGALLAGMALYAALAAGGFDPNTSLQGSHGGVGAFSTYIVLVLPLLPLLLAPRPVGFGSGGPTLAATGFVFALLLAAARLTGNRMIWLAIAAAILLAAILAAWRWRGRLKRAPRRWGGVVVGVLLLLGVLFVSATLERTRIDFKQDTTLVEAIADDPRFPLWEYSFDRIRERPWSGFGFGKAILGAELQGELGDPLLTHAHNLFVSQWLQIGAIGMLALIALFAALAWRYWTFVLGTDGVLAAIGVAGLVMLLAFVVKNLTDDFMIRPTSREFWALNAVLIGFGIRRARRDAAPETLGLGTEAGLRDVAAPVWNSSPRQVADANLSSGKR